MRPFNCTRAVGIVQLGQRLRDLHMHQTAAWLRQAVVGGVAHQVVRKIPAAARRRAQDAAPLQIVGRRQQIRRGQQPEAAARSSGAKL